jgi:L-threonylcarbamoyladenylate synthase
MRILRIDAVDPAEADLAPALDVLRAGGILAYPTDTFYGLAVDPRRDDAVARLYRAKNRDPHLAIPMIAGNVEQAQALGLFDETALALAHEFWPGPLSLVVRAASQVSEQLLGEGRTIAVRVPAHPVARAIALELGSAVTATSANVSGHPPVTRVDQIGATLAARIDAALDAGPTPGGPPSTLVSITEAGPQLVRPGAIAWERVLEFLR